MSDEEDVYLSDDVSDDDDEEEEVKDVDTVRTTELNPKNASVLIDHKSALNDKIDPKNLFITKYEYTRMKGIRIEQLQRGSIPFVPYTQHDTSETLFRREFVEGQLPFKIQRKLPDGTAVFLHVRDFANRSLDEYD